MPVRDSPAFRTLMIQKMTDPDVIIFNRNWRPT